MGGKRPEETRIYQRVRKERKKNKPKDEETQARGSRRDDFPTTITLQPSEELIELFKSGKFSEETTEKKGEFNYRLLLFFLVLCGIATWASLVNVEQGITSGAAIHILNEIVHHADFIPLEQTLTSTPAKYDYGVATADAIVGAVTVKGIRRLFE